MTRLDVYLAERLGSRAAAQKAIAEGRVTVDGVVRPKRHQVAEGERVEVSSAPAVPESGTEPARFEVVFEDDDVLVVEKPAGVVVHPGSAVAAGTLVQALEGRVAGGDDPARPGVVHRLDRDTSGLLVLARTQAAWEALGAQIRAREVEREYVALVAGRPPARAGTIDAPLGRDRRRRTRRSSDTDDPREAVTHFVAEEDFEGATLLAVTLETGRTHQIRAHLLAIGHPVLGDPEYGRPHPTLGRQFLHARRLAFAHPRGGERVELRSPLPADLAATLETFRNPTLR
ncbi:MAG: rRNA synthase [Solirubrobacteraceae bacterium]|nr:rRNA synthase [Solirubrobacteraceae bacterium]